MRNPTPIGERMAEEASPRNDGGMSSAGTAGQVESTIPLKAPMQNENAERNDGDERAASKVHAKCMRQSTAHASEVSSRRPMRSASQAWARAVPRRWSERGM